ncbi:hypothetical protein [Streptomyces acidicola]|uniref:hypothetical protein n=1 Tax=Streptomyces acidicola TaxID=2596892 RepID=UPI003822F478
MRLALPPRAGGRPRQATSWRRWTTTYQGYRVGIWLKNARAAARKAAEIEQRRAEGLLVESVAGALSEERREVEQSDSSDTPEPPFI